MIFALVIIAAIVLILRVKTSASSDGVPPAASKEDELPYTPEISIKAQRKILDPNAAAILKFGVQYGVPVWVIVGLINTESGGNNNVKGSKGEVGMMQLYHAGAIADWRKQFGSVYSDEFFAKAENNIQVGTWHLAQGHARTGANWLNTAIHVYQVGAGGYLAGRRSPDKSARVKRFTEAVIIGNPYEFVS